MFHIFNLDVEFEILGRIQRAFNGLSSITTPCERDSTMQERMCLVQHRFYPCIKEEIFPVSQSNENFFEWRKIELEEKQEDQLGREFDK